MMRRWIRAALVGAAATADILAALRPLFNDPEAVRSAMSAFDTLAFRSWAGRYQVAGPLVSIERSVQVEDRLETVFLLEGFIHADTKIVATLLDHPAIHIGSGVLPR